MKTMYLSNFQNFRLLVCVATSQLSTNQPKTNKMATNDGQLKLKIYDIYRRFFNVNTGNGTKVMWAVPEIFIGLHKTHDLRVL